jgi:NAD(P)-dependent dehydrogenase (short-subunit alcohol dehydrogenase family)
MELSGRTVVVTGGASGIGAALAARAVAEGAAAVAIVDVREDAVTATAQRLGVAPVVADLASAQGVRAAVEAAESAVGHIDVWCSNAGVAVGGDLMVDDEGWQLSWDVNVMAGVRAARLLVPGWVERGEGVFISTVSASGLLNHILAAAYGVTKAAALSFAENLAMTHGLQGVRVLAVCPQGVRTPMLDTDPSGFLDHGAIQPEDVAEAVVRGLADDRRFLVLPHPEVAEMAGQRAENHDRWVAGMRRFRERVVSAFDGDPTDWTA